MEIVGDAIGFLSASVMVFIYLDAQLIDKAGRSGSLISLATKNNDSKIRN